MLVLSYPWADYFHPDRAGELLRTLLPIFKICYAKAVSHHEMCTVGVMIDYMCLPQVPRSADHEDHRVEGTG